MAKLCLLAPVGVSAALPFSCTALSFLGVRLSIFFFTRRGRDNRKTSEYTAQEALQRLLVLTFNYIC